MTLLVRDESDIVEHFLVYHLNRGVDHVLVIDDESTDGTREILDSFRKAGLITVVPRPPGTWLEDEPAWRTQLARQAAASHQADWVLTGDADEFWWPLWGDLKDVLCSVPPQREAVMAPRNDFAFSSPPSRNAIQDFTVREKRSPLLPKLAFRGSTAVTVFSGAHRVTLGPSRPTMTDTQIGRPLRISPTPGLRIFHYGVRSEAQFERLRGGPGAGRTSASLRDALYRRVAETTPLPELGHGWRQDVIDRGIADGELFVDDRLAAFYEGCHDPRRESHGAASHSAQPPSPTEAEHELLEVQTLIFDHFQAEDAKLVNRVDRLRAKVWKERQARRRSASARAHSAISKLANLVLQRLRARNADGRSTGVERNVRNP